MSRLLLLLLTAAVWCASTLGAFAASSNVNSLTASPAIVGTQLFYCPIGATTDYKCSAAQIAAYNYSLMSGDCTATSLGAITCTKTNGTAFTNLSTLAGVAAGDLAYFNGTTWVRLPGNTGTTNFLSESASGVPSWAAGTSAGVSSLSTNCPASGPSTGAVTLNNQQNPVAVAVSTAISASTDCGKWFEVTGSGVTMTFPALAAGMAGFQDVIQNKDPTNSVTVTSGATINGATNIVLPPGSSIAVVAGACTPLASCTPTYWNSTSGVGDALLTFSTIGTVSYTPNSSLQWADVACIGAGGGGGGGGNTTSATTAVSGGGGGGSGSSKYVRVSAARMGHAAMNITNSAGGTAGAGTAVAGQGGNGGLGGNATVAIPSGSLVCYGGGGGAGGNAGANSGGGGGGGWFAAGPSATGATGAAGGTGGGGPGGGGAAGQQPTLGCAGAGGGGSLASTGGGFTSNNACAPGGSGGGGVTAASAAQAGAQGLGPFAVLTMTSGGSAGATGGGAGGNAGTGIQTDGTLLVPAGGPAGGGSGGGGGGSVGTTGGNAGTSGVGAGGSGGGGCQNAACTSGNGAVGGQSYVQIYEHNAATGLNH